MSGDSIEDNRLYGPLRKSERVELTDYLIEKVGGWEGCTPFLKEPEGDWRQLEHRPDLKGSRLFPFVVYREASRISTEFVRTVLHREHSTKASDGPTLRMVTLRLAAPRPAPKDLDDHLSALSKVVSQVFDDIQGKKSRGKAIATPLLTALHVRMSGLSPGCFDPHVHAIFDVSDDMIKPVREYFEDTRGKDGERHFGAVWVGPERVKNPRDAAFYVALGVVDHPRIRTWPEDGLRAIWDLQRHRMIRKAGWFRGAAGDTEDMVPANDDAPETPLEDAGRPSRATNEPRPAEPSGSDPGAFATTTGQSVAGADWRDALIRMLRPYHRSQQEKLIKTTVRAVSPERKNLVAYPTLGETLACAIIVVEAEQRDFARRYAEVLDAYGFDRRQVDKAIERVEASFNLRLFHSAGGFVPTPEGLTWAQVIGESFEPIIDLSNVGQARLLESHGDRERLPEHLKR